MKQTRPAKEPATAPPRPAAFAEQLMDWNLGRFCKATRRRETPQSPHRRLTWVTLLARQTAEPDAALVRHQKLPAITGRLRASARGPADHLMRQPATGAGASAECLLLYRLNDLAQTLAAPQESRTPAAAAPALTLTARIRNRPHPKRLPRKIPELDIGMARQLSAVTRLAADHRAWTALRNNPKADLSPFEIATIATTAVRLNLPIPDVYHARPPALPDLIIIADSRRFTTLRKLGNQWRLEPPHGAAIPAAPTIGKAVAVALQNPHAWLPAPAPAH